MELKIDPGKKLVEIWLTKAEREDAALQAKLKPLYKKYKFQGCLVAVFSSGTQDLADTTSDLLCYNRKHLA